MLRPRSAYFGAALLVVIAFGSRFAGIGHLLPGYPEGDTHYVIQASVLRENSAPIFPAYSAYPHLFARLLCLFPLRNDPEHARSPGELEEHLRLASLEILQGRLLIAAFAALGVILSWRLARRFLPPWWSLVAAGFVATSLLHLTFSQQARPHAASSSLALAGVLGCLALARGAPGGRLGSWTSYAVASLGVTAAVCSLHTGIFVLPALFVAHLFVARHMGSRAHLRLLLPGLALAAGVYFFYPFLFEDLQQPRRGTAFFPYEAVGWERLNGRGFAYLFKEGTSYDPVLTWLAIAGGVAVLARIVLRRGPTQTEERRAEKRRDALVVCAYALPHALALSIYDHVWQRFLLPLVPFAAVLAAYTLREIANALPRPAWRREVSVVVAAAGLAVPAIVSAKLVALRLRPDTIELCAAWVQEHVQPGSELVLTSPWLSLPLFQPIPIALDYRPEHSVLPALWYKHQARIPPSWTRGRRYHIAPVHSRGQLFANLREFRAESALTGGILRQFRPHYVAILPHHISREMDGEVRRWGRMIAHFDPFRPDPGRPFVHHHWMYQSTKGARIWHLVWRAEALGPFIEVYEPRSPLAEPR